MPRFFEREEPPYGYPSCFGHVSESTKHASWSRKQSMHKMFDRYRGRKLTPEEEERFKQKREKTQKHEAEVSGIIDKVMSDSNVQELMKNRDGEFQLMDKEIKKFISNFLNTREFKHAREKADKIEQQELADLVVKKLQAVRPFPAPDMLEEILDRISLSITHRPAWIVDNDFLRRRDLIKEKIVKGLAEEEMIATEEEIKATEIEDKKQ